MISRLSEEFGGALPSVILAERQRLPVGFMERVIEVRAYAQTKAAYDHSQNPKAEGPILTMVKRNEAKVAADAQGIEFRE